MPEAVQRGCEGRDGVGAMIDRLQVALGVIAVSVLDRCRLRRDPFCREVLVMA